MLAYEQVARRQLHSNGHERTRCDRLEGVLREGPKMRPDLCCARRRHRREPCFFSCGVTHGARSNAAHGIRALDGALGRVPRGVGRGALVGTARRSPRRTADFVVRPDLRQKVRKRGHRRLCRLSRTRHETDREESDDPHHRNCDANRTHNPPRTSPRFLGVNRFPGPHEWNDV